MFKSLNHFELILAIVWNGVEFYFFVCGYPVFPTPSVKKVILSQLSILGILIKYKLTTYVGVYFWIFCSTPLIYVSIISILYYFDYCSFVAYIETRKYDIFDFVFGIALAIQDLLWFQSNFKIVISIFVTNVIGILVEIALTLQIAWVVWTF